MGNVLLEYRRGDPAQGYEKWLQQNPDLISKQILAENKLFRTSSYALNGRYIILKACFTKQSQSLTEYIKIFEHFNKQVEQQRVNTIVPLKLIQSGRQNSFVVAYRQKMQQTLEDIISSKPSQNFLKKKWLIFQMIQIVALVHKNFNFYHGHIRSSNFVVTSYGYLMLTDFAFYKPLYMFEDTDQGFTQIRLFYSASNNNCTLAPQKMKQKYQLKSSRGVKTNKSPDKNASQLNKSESTTSINNPSDSPKSNITENKSKILEIDNIKNISKLQKMDIFSLGCTLLELLRDGKPSLNYQMLLKFKKYQFSFDPIIKEACSTIDNQQQRLKIYQMIRSMLSINPQQRPHIDEIQKIWNSIIDYDVYTLFLHCLSAFATASFHLPDLRICLIYSIFKFIQNQERSNTNQFKIRLPRCLESFQALSIFKSLIKNKIIYVDQIREGSILHKIINSEDKANVIDSDQQIIQESDTRRQFFVPQKLKRITSVRTSISVIPKLQKILCPPQWDRNLLRLIQLKTKGLKLTPQQIRRNKFQEYIQQIKKNQFLRQIRKQQTENYYQKYSMMIRVIYSCIRGCKYNGSKLIAIQMMMFISRETSDQIKLKRVFPYLISLLQDPDLAICKYALHSIIDLFYSFIDPFQNDEDTAYAQIFIECIVNNINSQKVRLTIFERLAQIYNIVQWLQVHIRKYRPKQSTKNIQQIIDAIKQNYANFKALQIRELILSMPTQMWPDLFEFFVSFINSQKVLGLQKSIQIASQDVQIFKKKFDIIDNCVQSALSQNGLSLFFSIRYFTHRRISNPDLMKKIAPLVIHPHLWVQMQAKQYIKMCLEQNPSTRIFSLCCEIFEPPFPLQAKDLQNQFLLPEPLDKKDVDFNKRQINSSRKIGLAQNNFLNYLKNMKNSKNFPVTKAQQVEIWENQVRNIMENKHQPIYFSHQIKKTAIQLFEDNFLYFVGNTKSVFNHNAKQQQKRAAYLQFNDILKKIRKFSLDDYSISHQKKEFFLSLLTLINNNFQKLLTKSTRIKEEEKVSIAINKVSMSENLYSIMEIIYKFQQFQVKQSTKFGQFYKKQIKLQKLQKPKGQLITQIYQHKDIVTCLQNIADNFLVSGSYDGTIKVFNLKKLQINVTTDSQISYELTSQQSQEKIKINTISAFQNTSTFAVGTSKGQIRLYQVQRMPKKGYDINRSIKNQNFQIMKYSIGGEIQKVITCKNDKLHECLCFVTAEGLLGVQDIRMKTKSITNNLGKQRGMPKCLTFSSMGPSLLIGTLDGYILTYDIRCNIINNIRQLQYDNQPITVTNIYQSPHKSDERPIFAVTYPSKYYQFSYFDIYSDDNEVLPVKHYSSADRQQIIYSPTLTNKTKQQNFKLFNNSLAQKIYYKQLPDFNRNFKILDYLSDPFTIRQIKIRQVWMDRCKHRYNQIYSIYNKKSLPFLQHLEGGILTNLNPIMSDQYQGKNAKNLSLLVDRRQSRQYNQIQKPVNCRPTGSNIYSFNDEQNSDFLTCCAIFPKQIATGGWDSVIKIYR